MRGRDRFNAEELAWIREQLAQLRLAERDEQKRIRGRLRRARFRISDWPTSNPGFTPSDFEHLVSTGQLVLDDTVGMIPAGPDPNDVNLPGGPLDDWAAHHTTAALDALAGPHVQRHGVPELIETAEAGRPPGVALNRPGLYALYGKACTWRELGLGDPPDGRPLYVGKAEDSLVSRDLRTHFATGRTGQSSPRRSFAALLVDQLRLVAVPRRRDDPEAGKWTHYALETDGDERLTTWMRAHLRLAAWPCERPVALGKLERLVMGELKPPLNLTGVSQPWSRDVRAARAEMARAAEALGCRAQVRQEVKSSADLLPSIARPITRAPLVPQVASTSALHGPS